MKRSINFVSNFPAMKSGSERMRWCSGIEAWMPCTMNISRARFIRAILSVDNQLCNHRVIIRRHHATLILRRIHADAGSAGYVEDGDLACRGGEFLGMLG